VKALRKLHTTTLNAVRGYVSGVYSGVAWGFDAVLLGAVMAMAPYAENPVLVASGAILTSALHDVFAAIWMAAYMARQGRLKELGTALKTRDGRWCALSALFGGPLAMTFYVLAIATGGAALTASVTAIFPLLGMVLAVIILKEKTGVQSWLGVLLCVAGIMVMGHTPSDAGQVNVLGGISLSLVAALGWAAEGVVCGYGMKDGKVDPMMALLIREITSGLAYVAIVAPLLMKGFGNFVAGSAAFFAYWPAWVLLAFVSLMGMSSYGSFYAAIDSIGAAKSLCLNATYSFWAVVLTWFLATVLPTCFQSTITTSIVIGSVCMFVGVSMAALYQKK